MELLTVAAGRFRDEGLPVDVVSAGATGTYDDHRLHPGCDRGAGRVLRPHGPLHGALAPEFAFALTVAATAISVHGDLVVFDAGRKAIGTDFHPPASPDGRGELAFIHEEHVGYRYREGARYRVGDRVSLVPDYAPTTVNLFGAFHVVEEGRVVDVWQVLARHGDA